MIYKKIGVSSNTELMDSLSMFRTGGTCLTGSQMASPMEALSEGLAPKV